MENILVEKQFTGNTVRWRIDIDYVSATDICRMGGKQWSNYKSTKENKEYVRLLSAILNKPQKDLVISVTANSSLRGTWVHPRIAIHLAQWISPLFCIKISEWIQEWAEQSPNNFTKLMKEYENIEPSQTLQLERQIQEYFLLKEDGSQKEVKTEAGFIDVLTKTHIFEIKSAHNWKHALGQILSYSAYLPTYSRKIILFGEEEDRAVLPIASHVCSSLDVEVDFISTKYFKE